MSLIKSIKHFFIRQLAKEGQRDALLSKLHAYFNGQDTTPYIIAQRYWRLIAYKHRKNK